jgi:hypothetical protein
MFNEEMETSTPQIVTIPPLQFLQESGVASVINKRFRSFFNCSSFVTNFLSFLTRLSPLLVVSLSEERPPISSLAKLLEVLEFPATAVVGPDAHVKGMNVVSRCASGDEIIEEKDDLGEETCWFFEDSVVGMVWAWCEGVLLISESDEDDAGVGDAVDLQGGYMGSMAVKHGKNKYTYS